jgi:hypothetical protein
VDILKGLDLEEVSFSDGGGKRHFIGDRLITFDQILKSIIDTYFTEGNNK